MVRLTLEASPHLDWPWGYSCPTAPLCLQEGKPSLTEKGVAPITTSLEWSIPFSLFPTPHSQVMGGSWALDTFRLFTGMTELEPPKFSVFSSFIDFSNIKFLPLGEKTTVA